jgi:hypothetical protein
MEAILVDIQAVIQVAIQVAIQEDMVVDIQVAMEEDIQAATAAADMEQTSLEEADMEVNRNVLKLCLCLSCVCL